MFIAVKRQEGEKSTAVGTGTRLIDAVMTNSDQGLFLIDGKDRILPQVSRSLGTLFRRQEFADLSFEKLLAPLVSGTTLTRVRNHISGLFGGLMSEGGPAARALKDVEVRLTNTDGSSDTAHYGFDFDAVDLQGEPPVWLVRVTDITLQVETLRELEELRVQARTQGEILRGVLQMGGARFGIFLQKADASMKTIGKVLKKSARAEDAFRNKLEETLGEVDRIRREAAAFKLTSLELAAREFEDAVHDLRSRSALSGSDFLPLAVKLDHLYGQFAQIKSFTVAAASMRAAEPAAASVRITDNGTQIIEAPKLPDETELKPGSVDALLNASQQPRDVSSAPAAPMVLRARAQRAPAGSLDSTLLALTDHVADEQKKEVVLETHGLHLVPARYAAAIKNVAIQLIRNAVMHGIEYPTVREAAGKALNGTLRVDFKLKEDGFEMMFEDDGCGIDPARVRQIAIERGIITADAGKHMRDREAIKLIFKSRFSTLTCSAEDATHGAGMSLVRRYVHEAGGKIALASLTGHETRFKITLPAVVTEPDIGSAHFRVA